MKDSDFNIIPNNDYLSLMLRIETYCRDYQKSCENTGQGTKYRTFREVSKRFGLTYDQLETIIDDCLFLGIVDAVSENKGEWEVGYY